MDSLKIMFSFFVISFLFVMLFMVWLVKTVVCWLVVVVYVAFAMSMWVLVKGRMKYVVRVGMRFLCVTPIVMAATKYIV